MQKDIQQTWFFPQPPNEVWEYLTKPELIEQWLVKTDFKPIVGQKFRFANSCEAADGLPHFTFCEVLEIIPYKLLSYSWQKGTTEKEIKLHSVVTWTLTGKDKGTELKLRHDGFTHMEDMIAHTEGWKDCLEKISQLIHADSHANANA